VLTKLRGALMTRPFLKLLCLAMDSEKDLFVGQSYAVFLVDVEFFVY